jgi:hypothetical protein
VGTCPRSLLSLSLLGSAVSSQEGPGGDPLFLCNLKGRPFLPPGVSKAG